MVWALAALGLAGVGVAPGGCRGGPDASRYGPRGEEWLEVARDGWVLRSLDGAPVASGAGLAEQTLVVGSTGHIQGSGGINRFAGLVDRDGEDRGFRVTELQPSALESPEQPEATARESRYFAALREVDRYRLTARGSRLELYAGDEPRLGFERVVEPEARGPKLRWWQRMGLEPKFVPDRYD